jgi:hypothetical protein
VRRPSSPLVVLWSFAAIQSPPLHVVLIRRCHLTCSVWLQLFTVTSVVPWLLETFGHRRWSARLVRLVLHKCSPGYLAARCRRGDSILEDIHG